MRLCELQHAAVFAKLGDEGEDTEEQPVSSLLLLLLGHLPDEKNPSSATMFQLKAAVAARGAQRQAYVFIVVRVRLLLQQGQQAFQAPAKALLLHLHIQAADLSPEAPQAGLRDKGML